MFKTLPMFLLLAVGICQSNDPILSLIEMYGPIKPVATNQGHSTTQGQIGIIMLGGPNEKETTGIDLLCSLPDGDEGECVPHNLCRDNKRVINSDPSIRKCSSSAEICCPFDKVSREPIRLIPVQLSREGCGYANPDGLGEQTSNNDEYHTKFGEFPWMVGIIKVELVTDKPKRKSILVYVGGGSLIHPSVVLTAAHYVTDKKNLKARAGEWNTQVTTELYPFQERNVASMEIHKDFIKETTFYDIAVLFLDKPVELAPNVGVVCLPPPRVPQKEHTRCYATGWGKDKPGKEGRYQVVLKKVELPVVRHDVCEAILRQTRLGKHFILHSSFMCAGGERGKDTCTGDGGAPLSCPIEYERDRYVQSGIVAWGIGCGEDGVPGVYVDVSNLRDWIDDKVVGKGYDPKVYTY